MKELKLSIEAKEALKKLPSFAQRIALAYNEELESLHDGLEAQKEKEAGLTQIKERNDQRRSDIKEIERVLTEVYKFDIKLLAMYEEL